MFDPMMHDTPPAENPAVQEAIGNLLTGILRGIEERSENEESRLSAGLMRRSKELTDLAMRKMSRFAGDKTGTVTLDTLKAANEALDRATAILTDFLTEHPAPELTCFDRDVTPIRPL